MTSYEIPVTPELLAMRSAIDESRRWYLAVCETTIRRTVERFIGEGCPKSAEDILTVLNARGYEGMRFCRHLQGVPDTFAILNSATGEKAVEVEFPRFGYSFPEVKCP